MKPIRAEDAAKSQIIDARIQRRYELLAGGRLLEGDRLERIRRLPLDEVRRLADDLDRTSPGHPSPSTIVEKALFEHDEACRARDRGALDATGVVASVDMYPR